ncbi:MAG: hypothetical protein JWP51_5015 [Bradyrhizobium sp.]|nr:hypothetical protein [Bradyrhizobium sp.]
MPRRKSPSTGPMNVQPVEHGSIRPTQLRPIVPTIGDKPKTTRPKKSTRAEAVRVAMARIMRRNSLRKQRKAQRGARLTSGMHPEDERFHHVKRITLPT